MATTDDLVDQIFDALKREYDSDGRNRISQEELDSKKSVPQDSSLMVSSYQSGPSTGMRLPAVRPAIDNRRGRKAAEEEQVKQWNMVQKTNRTALASESVAAVCVHGFKVMDRAVSAISDEFYGVKRNEAMNEVMKRFAAKCIAHCDSGVLAVVESHPKRIAEDL
jgi:hypothetical protein